MKRTKKILSTALVGMFIAQAGFGQSFIPLGTSTDDYIGGDPTNSSYIGADVIGTNSVFDLTGAEMAYSLTNGSLQIKILGNYFDNILTNSDLLGTEMGDLFISTDGLNWGGSGENSDTTLDHFGSGIETSWEYAVQLGTYKQPGLTSGTEMTGKMVDMSAAGTGIELSSATGIFRSNQEHQVTTTSDWAYNLTDPTWVIENGSLTITLNDFSDFFGSELETMGFHWTMECANDVVEFEVEFGSITTLPEPSTIGFLGLLGMGGILLLRRKIYRRK